MNGTVVGITAFASDVHGGTVNYSLTGDASGRFQIDSNTGVVTVKNSALLNFESAASHTITVRATDGLMSSTQQFIISITNVTPTLPLDANAAMNTISEGAVAGTPVGITAGSTDVNGGQITFSLSDDAGGRFQIDPVTGVVSVKDATLLNFESATSHTITVRATDGTVASQQQFLIAVTNVAPAQPIDANVATNSVSEGASNGSLVGITVTAPDIHGGQVSYTLVDDAGGRFQIDSVTGVVSVKNANLVRFQGGTTHSITVQGTDGTSVSATQSFTIAVTNAPAIVGSTTVQRAADGTLTITDTAALSSDNLTLSLVRSNLRIVDPTTTFGGTGGIDFSTPGVVQLLASTVNKIVVNAKDNADTLTLDFTSGNMLPSGGLSYDGGIGSANALIIKNAGSVFTKTIIRPLTANSGSIEFVSGGSQYVVTYTNLSSVRLEGTESANLVLDLTNNSDTATLSNSGTSNDGRMLLAVTGQLGVDFSVAGIQTLTVQGNGGNDRISVASLDSQFAGQLILDGGTGDDFLDLSKTTTKNQLIGGIGNDMLIGGSGRDYLDGGDGNDNLQGNAGDDLLIGGVGNDVIEGNDGNDTIAGDAGNDTLNGGKGNDVISGGFGNDVLRGGDGDDILLGDAGADQLFGEAGADGLIGGIDTDRDELDGGSAPTGRNDVINGNISVDKIKRSKKEINTNFTFDFTTLLSTIKRWF